MPLETMFIDENHDKKKHCENNTRLETIVVDEESSHGRPYSRCDKDKTVIINVDSDISLDSEDSDIIVVSVQDETASSNGGHNKYDLASCNDVYKENKLLTEFIENCINLKNSKGMLRVINRLLIPMYKETDNDFKKSSLLQKVLIKAINKLEKEPDLKFSHLRNLCEVLKFHKKLPNLKENVKDSDSTKYKQKYSDCINRKIKKPRIETSFQPTVIDLDDSEQVEVPVINVDEYDDNNIIVLDNREILVDDGKENKNCSSSKELEHGKEKAEYGAVEHSREKAEDCEEETKYRRGKAEYGGEKVDGEGKADYEEENKLLTPKKTETYSEFSTSIDIEKVKAIEAQIASYKRIITELEEQEVDDDTIASPYIKSESFKVKVVTLYKELCQLTGEQPVKRRTIRLQVVNGHPEGPVRRLEKFLNDNIGSQGDPPFPDFCDVVKCVTMANISDGLGWTKPQIMREASALFTQCGRALQKRRQQREWRDLIGRVKLEENDIDPADKDPELLARLEENKRIARRKETDLLERYSNMQHLPQEEISKLQTIIYNNGDESQEVVIEDNDSESSVDLNEDDNSEDDIDNNDATVVTHAKDYSENKTDVYNINSNTDISALTAIESSVNNEHKNESEVVKIKIEPTENNVLSLLETIRGNFTATVMDIEDPFLVIEISSEDSSDESEV